MHLLFNSNFEAVAIQFGSQFYEAIGVNNAALAPLLVMNFLNDEELCDGACLLAGLK